MLALSRIAGHEVVGPDGNVVGRLADLTVRLGTAAGPQLVERILVRRDGSPPLLIPWSEVADFRHVRIELASDASDFVVTSTPEALEDDEILLARDVLDTQIVDVVGQRLARVSDVVLARTNHHLELVGVEVGFAAVLRRLGLRRLAQRSREDAVAWTDLHLTSERGHAVQLATPRSTVNHLDARGLAALVTRLDTESAAEVLAAKSPGVAADVVRVAHPGVAERLLRALPGRRAAQIVAAMPAEHAHRWRSRLAHVPVLRGRRFSRWHVWPRRGAR